VALVADCFGDDDTLALAHAHARVSLDAERGIDGAELRNALEQLAGAHRPLGIVCGTGFEDRPCLLAWIAQRWRLLGNTPETIARLKDPLSFAALCRSRDIPHPQTTLGRPADTADWIAKRPGGAGGTHVRSLHDPNAGGCTTYYQRRVTGHAISALLLGNGNAAVVLGFSAQWPAPAPGRPFRYGGAVRPAPLTRELNWQLAKAVRRLAAAVPLVGLNSFDFMVDDDAFWLLEINPRPGATLDIFEPRQHSLFGLHVAACRGMLPEKAPNLADAAAACIVYADRDVRSVPRLAWPPWTADRQRSGSSLRNGDPFCTVLACASTAAEAREVVKQRAAAILAMLNAHRHDELAAH
jgi:predicted ATP-grasp superfamily ATP-dependent carboligase